MRAELFIDYY